MKVPYRIETERLVIRPYDPRDAPILKETVERSREHLWPWMDWTPAGPESPVNGQVPRDLMAGWSPCRSPDRQDEMQLESEP